MKKQIVGGMRTFLKVIISALVVLELFAGTTGLGAAFPGVFKANFWLMGVIGILLIGIAIGYFGRKGKIQKRPTKKQEDEDDD